VNYNSSLVKLWIYLLIISKPIRCQTGDPNKQDVVPFWICLCITETILRCIVYFLFYFGTANEK